MHYQGRIINWNDSKGFGFVMPNGGGDKAFVHISAFANRQRRPCDGDLITYVVSMDKQHRLQAGNIKFADDSRESSGRLKETSIGLFFALLFCCVALASVIIGKLPYVVLFFYAIASGIAFFTYAFDKSAAQNSRSRTPESTLHFLGLIGGWPGALLAQKMFRHKSKKAEFQAIFWITVFINCGVFAWLFTDAGSSFLRGIPGWR